MSEIKLNGAPMSDAVPPDPALIRHASSIKEFAEAIVKHIGDNGGNVNLVELIVNFNILAMKFNALAEQLEAHHNLNPTLLLARLDDNLETAVKLAKAEASKPRIQIAQGIKID